MWHHVLKTSKVAAYYDERLWKSEPEQLKIQTSHLLQSEPNTGVAALVILNSGNGLHKKYPDAPFLKEMEGLTVGKYIN